MIISNKQIMYLLQIAQSSMSALSSNELYKNWSRDVAKLLDTINNQQSDILREIDEMPFILNDENELNYSNSEDDEIEEF